MLFVRGHAVRKRPAIEYAKPFKIDGDYCRLIPLTRGFWAIVDVKNYTWLMQWKWCAYVGVHGVYAGRVEVYDNGKRRHVHMSRLIAKIPAGKDADHGNRNTLDNRESNLRPASRSQNLANSKLKSTNTTGFRGVSRLGRYYVASISVGRKRKYLGSRKTPEAAAELYKKASLEIYGEFSPHRGV